ncbi:hypothetical protein F4604DRAFT_1677002 [Suillus subluteus]|nr:hypothetical protein F4604DRAFT_1677002 [Suillus subluteus]
MADIRENLPCQLRWNSRSGSWISKLGCVGAGVSTGVGEALGLVQCFSLFFFVFLPIDFRFLGLFDLYMFAFWVFLPIDFRFLGLFDLHMFAFWVFLIFAFLCISYKYYTAVVRVSNCLKESRDHNYHGGNFKLSFESNENAPALDWRKRAVRECGTS